MVDLSIIIISYNTRQITLDCLRSLYDSLLPVEFSFEVIIFDNASSDDSVVHLKKVSQYYPNLKIIENKENIGFGRGNNIAIKQANGRNLLLLNSDIIVLGDAIRELYEAYNKHKVGFLAGRLLNKDMTLQPSAATFYNLTTVFGALFLRGDHWGLTRYSPDYFCKVDWASGACLFTSRELYDKLNGFDEEIFMYFEEVDLLYRASKLGYETWFLPQAEFIHLGSASSDGKTYPILQVYKGLIYFYKKHYHFVDLKILQIMLQLKALIALIIGRLLKNQYLIKTYAQAFKLAQVA